MLKRYLGYPSSRLDVSWIAQRAGEGIIHVLRLSHAKFASPAFEILFLGLVGTMVRFAFPRRRILKNIKRAFGSSYSGIAKKGLAVGVQHHLVRNMRNCFQQLVQPSYAATHVSLAGREHLDAALARGNGVIAVGAHIGNFPLVGARLGIEGLPFHVLFRVPSDDRIKSFIHRNVRHFHQRIIPSQPRRTAVRQILAALRNNGIVFMLADNLKRGEVSTNLFGQKVRSPRGPASLAIRSGAAVLPVYVIRNYHGRLELVIEPEIPVCRTNDLHEDILRNVHLITNRLEAIIRLYPDQWMWLTVRLRKQPEGTGNGTCTHQRSP